jgi:uncharacterized protein (DUF1778 family)
MSEPPKKKRGGSHSARARGDVGIVVHVTPEEHEELRRAAEAAGLTLKDYCKRVALEAARRLDPPAAPR